jgi:hypothetical protein
MGTLAHALRAIAIAPLPHQLGMSITYLAEVSCHHSILCHRSNDEEIDAKNQPFVAKTREH